MEFYCLTKESRDDWVKQLKRICVMYDITENYDVDKKLGKGSFGKVYLATRRSDGKIFAIKSMNKRILYRSTRNIVSLIKEIEILRLMDHPNIVKLYEVYESNEHVRLVLEYIEGGDLMSHLKNRDKYSERDASVLIMQTLQTIDYCHSRNIIHRDLKPENLMVT